MAPEERIRHRKPKNSSDPIQSTRSKPTISSILSNLTHNNTPTDESPTSRKKYFTSTKFRGLGCTAPAQVSVPAIIRSSADWDGKKVRKRKQKKKKNCSSSGNEVSRGGIGLVMSANNTPAPAGSSSCLVVPDVWCGPGIAASVDCVVSRRPVSGRGKVDVDKISTRERSSYSGRRMVHPEDVPFFDVFGSRHHPHLRNPSPEGLAEIVMFQGNLLMGGRLDLDRYRDWRLDVDTMSYEELLELGDKIGYVNTGLKEDEIRRFVRKTKPTALSDDKSLSHVPSEMQRKCTICQEEYEGDDEIGKLDCGHFYHMYCIKQWLVHKKTCPVCKTSVECQH